MKGRIREGKLLFTEEEAERAKYDLILKSMEESESSSTQKIIVRGKSGTSEGVGVPRRVELERIIEEDIV